MVRGRGGRVSIQLIQIDEDLWVNPRDLTAVYSEDGITFIATTNSEFSVTGQSVPEVVGRLSEYVNLFYEE
jgi:hypothetical protein